MNERIDSADVNDCKMAFPSTSMGVEWHRNSLTDDVLNTKPGSKQYDKQEELANKWSISNSSDTFRRAETGSKCGDLVEANQKQKEREKADQEELDEVLHGAKRVVVSGILQHFSYAAIYPLHGSTATEQDLKTEVELKHVLPDVNFVEMTMGEMKLLGKHVLGTTAQRFSRDPETDESKWLVATDFDKAKLLLK